MSLDMLKELDEFSKSGSKRPARLYKFDEINFYLLIFIESFIYYLKQNIYVNLFL